MHSRISQHVQEYTAHVHAPMVVTMSTRAAMSMSMIMSLPVPLVTVVMTVSMTTTMPSLRLARIHRHVVVLVLVRMIMPVPILHRRPAAPALRRRRYLSNRRANIVRADRGRRGGLI